jgi:ABC-type sugar transport system substrate-binding protein
MPVKKRHQGLVMAAAAASLMLGLAACGSSGSASDSSSADTGGASAAAGSSAPAASAAPAELGTAGVSVFSLSNEFLASEAKLAAAALGAAGWDARPPVDAKASVDQQVTDVNNLIAAGATGLVIDPADSAGIVPALNAAEKAGVNVVLVDVGASGGKAYMTVRVDNAAAAAQVCDQMGKLLTDAGKSKGTVLELQGMLAQEAGQQRTSGFDECMAQKFPDITIIRQPTDWDAKKAADATQTVASSQDIDAIYMQSDCALLAGVQSALEQIGKSAPKGDPKHIIMGAIDGCAAALDAIRAGTLDFTVEQPLVTYADLSAKYLTDAANGVQPTEGPAEPSGEIVKNVTGFEHILDAVLVTDQNVDDPDRWGNAAKNAG